MSEVTQVESNDTDKPNIHPLQCAKCLSTDYFTRDITEEENYHYLKAYILCKVCNHEWFLEYELFNRSIE